MKYKALFSPITIGKLTIKNRVVMPAMGTGMANFDGTPSEQLIAYYRKRAESGTGLIISEITRVNDLHGATMPRQLSLSHDRYIKPFSLYVKTIQEAGGKFFCQLHHPGRQNLSVMVLFWPALLFIGRLFPSFWKIFPSMVPFVLAFMEKVWAPRVVAPSNVPCSYTKQKTRALKTKEVKKLVQDFARGAERAWKAGADGVEIHASHGYLIQQFLSPRTNKRNDHYGGAREKRLNFLLEIVRSVRERCGADFPISVRLTVNEYYCDDDQGITVEDGIFYARKLEEAGVDLLNVSSGTYETIDSWLEPISYEPGWRKELSSSVKNAVSIPVLGASFIRTPDQAEEQLQEGAQDMVAIGRGQIADPEWTAKAMAGTPELIRRCISCLNCFDSLNTNAAMGQPLQCTLNPELGFEGEEKKPSLMGKSEKALVIGAGPAGLSAALELALTGCHVEVWEKEREAGGQLKLAELPPHKDKISWFYKDILANLSEKGVSIQYGREASLDKVKAYGPDAIVLATGGTPLSPPIEGREKGKVYLYSQVLKGLETVPEGKVVVVGSGMSGLETAEFLATEKRDITIVEMNSEIGMGIYKQNKEDVVRRLSLSGVKFFTDRKLAEIETHSVVLENMKNGQKESLNCDAVVLAIGVRSNNLLQEELEREFPRVITIGDASKPGRIYDAVHSAYLSLS